MARIGPSRFSNYSQYELYLDVSEGSTNVLSNTSTVTAIMYIRKTSGTGRWNYDPYTAWIEINGSRKQLNPGSYDFRGVSTIEVGRHSVSVTHNADGGKSINVQGYVSAPNTVHGGRLGTASVSGSFGLTKFNRVASLNSAPGSFVANDGFTLSFSRRSNGLSYQARLQSSDGRTTYATKTGLPNGGSYRFSLSASELNSVYNAMGSTGVNLRIQLRTMSGGTIIGNSTRSIKATPRGISFSGGGGSITIGGSRSLSFTKHHTGMQFRYGLCYRGGGAWLPGFPLTTSSSSGTINTSSAATRDAIMKINPGSSTQTVGIWVEQLNGNGTRLGYSEASLNVLIPNSSISVSLTGYLSTIDVRGSVSGLTTSVSQVQYSLNGGGWTNASGLTFSLSGLSRNTSYSVRLRFRQVNSDIWYYSNTASVRTIADVSLSLNKSSGVVYSSFRASFDRDSRLSGKIKIIDFNGSLIDSFDVGSSSSKDLSYGYDRLGDPGVNNLNYSKEIKIVFECFDSKGTSSVSSKSFRYYGEPFPVSSTSPLETTSEGFFQIFYKIPSPLHALSYSVERLIDGKIVESGSLSGPNPFTYHFKEEDFGDYFDDNEFLRFKITVKDVFRGFVIYESYTFTNVKRHSELFVRVHNKWVKPYKIFKMSVADFYPMDSVYPRDDIFPNILYVSGTFPGFDTSPGVDLNPGDSFDNYIAGTNPSSFTNPGLTTNPGYEIDRVSGVGIESSDVFTYVFNKWTKVR